MSDEAAARVWSDPDTPATCLVALLLDRFGQNDTDGEMGVDDTNRHTGPLHWSAQTIEDEILHTAGVPLASRNLDRLMAAIAVMTRPDEFYASVPGFHTIACALAGPWFEPTVLEPLDAEEVLWALVESYLIDPPDEKDTDIGSRDGEPVGDTKIPTTSARYSPSVVRFINMLVKEDGFHRLPHVFPIYGLPEDPVVWSVTAESDYTADPELAPAVSAAADQREEDLAADLRDRLTDLADRVRRLPLGRSGPVADELAAAARGRRS